MLRGGSWNNKPRNLRSANRNRNTAGNRNNNNGFRLARTLRCWNRRPYGAVGRARERPGMVMMNAKPVPLLPRSGGGGVPVPRTVVLSVAPFVILSEAKNLELSLFGRRLESESQESRSRIAAGQGRWSRIR